MTFDHLADTYGLTIAVAAGNSGPGGSTVSSPAVAYNNLAVANWVTRGNIAPSSSRGPSGDGRKKPDVAAPGTNIRSFAYNWDSAGVAD